MRAIDDASLMYEFLRYLTFLHTSPLTVLYGMEESMANLSEMKSLTIHLVMNNNV